MLEVSVGAALWVAIKIELKSKQLTGCVAHLCKEGVTRISPGKKP